MSTVRNMGRTVSKPSPLNGTSGLGPGRRCPCPPAGRSPPASLPGGRRGRLPRSRRRPRAPPPPPPSREVLGNFQPFPDVDQRLRRKCADSVCELGTVEGRNLVAKGDAVPRQSAGSSGNQHCGWSSSRLCGRCREGDNNDRSPSGSTIESIVGNDDHRTPSPLLGARPGGQVGPVNLAPLHEPLFLILCFTFF